MVFENFQRISLTSFKENFISCYYHSNYKSASVIEKKNLPPFICVPSWLKMLYFTLLDILEVGEW